MNKLLPFVIVTCLAVPSVQAQQFTPLLDADIRDALHEVLSGEVAKDHVIQITRHHRIQGSRGYRHAAEYVLSQLARYGFSEEEARIESFPSDGKVQYQTWQSPSGWDIESAELRIIEPYEERIVGYPEIAMSVITYSNAGDATAELVWVGSGTSEADYEGKDVRGKFVLATGYGGSVHRLAVLEYGAVGVIAYLDDDRAKEYPDMLQYTGMWPRTEELERVTFGFNLTNRQGERLRSLLASGQRVVLRGRVSGIGLEPYEMDVVVARIPGSDLADEELVFSAHLDHPKESANDNASGSAAILDIARALKESIDSGLLSRPRRSIRFLWVPEWFGTVAYIDAHPEMTGPALGGKVLANLNLDMVGEHPEMLHSRLIMTRTPASIPSAVNDVVANMAQMVDGINVRTPRGSLSLFNYRVTPYSGGSDHQMFIERKIPGIMLSHSPDYTHHTSEDTPDKVDPVELERSEIIGAATMLYLASLSRDQAIDLVELVAAKSMERVGKAARRARREMVRSAVHDVASGTSLSVSSDVRFEALNALAHAAMAEHEAVSSVLSFNSTDQVREAVSAARRRITELESGLTGSLNAAASIAGIPVSDTDRPADDRVPFRLTRGPLDFGLPQSRLSPEDATWYASHEFTLNGNQRFELVNVIDGHRSVTAIRDALSAEYGPVALSQVARYLDDLVKVGVIGWR